MLERRLDQSSPYGPSTRQEDVLLKHAQTVLNSSPAVVSGTHLDPGTSLFAEDFVSIIQRNDPTYLLFGWYLDERRHRLQFICTVLRNGHSNTEPNIDYETSYGLLRY